MAIQMIRKYVFMVIGIVMIGATPALFQKIELHPVNYAKEIILLFKGLLTPFSLTYGDKVERHIFPYIFTPFFHSLVIVVGGFILSISLCILMAVVISFLKKRMIERIMLVLSLLETIPDIVYIISVQIVVIYICNLLHINTFQFAALGENQIYLLPIVILSIVPSIYLLRIELQKIAQESREDYVEFAKGKGLNKTTILVVHILRNTLSTLYINSKHILWLMLSSLFIVEYFFNVNGIMMFIYNHTEPMALTIGLMLMLTSFFILFTITELILKKLVG